MDCSPQPSPPASLGDAWPSRSSWRSTSPGRPGGAAALARVNYAPVAGTDPLGADEAEALVEALRAWAAGGAETEDAEAWAWFDRARALRKAVGAARSARGGAPPAPPGPRARDLYLGAEAALPTEAARDAYRHGAIAQLLSRMMVRAVTLAFVGASIRPADWAADAVMATQEAADVLWLAGEREVRGGLDASTARVVAAVRAVLFPKGVPSEANPLVRFLRGAGRGPG